MSHVHFPEYAQMAVNLINAKLSRKLADAQLNTLLCADHGFDFVDALRLDEHTRSEVCDLLVQYFETRD